MDSNSLFEKYEKIAIYIVLACIMAFIGFVLVNAAETSHDNWKVGLEIAKSLEGDNAQSIFHISARGYDFFVVKSASLFLAFMVVALGAVLVIYGAEATYKLRIKNPASNRSSLETSSPGLVLVTLGAILVVITLLNKTTIETSEYAIIDDSQFVSDEDTDQQSEAKTNEE